MHGWLCSPSTSCTCKLKKTSTIRPLVTSSRRSCLRWGVALAHSSVLRLLSVLKGGRVGAVVADLCTFSFALLLLATGLPETESTRLLASSSSAARAFSSSRTARKSVELRECPMAFCSLRASNLAGDLRVCGRASSSKTWPFFRAGDAGAREMLRREMAIRLRSLRLVGSSHDASARLGEVCCAMHYSVSLSSRRVASRLVLDSSSSSSSGSQRAMLISFSKATGGGDVRP